MVEQWSSKPYVEVRFLLFLCTMLFFHKPSAFSPTNIFFSKYFHLIHISFRKIFYILYICSQVKFLNTPLYSKNYFYVKDLYKARINSIFYSNIQAKKIYSNKLGTNSTIIKFAFYNYQQIVFKVYHLLSLYLYLNLVTYSYNRVIKTNGVLIAEINKKSFFSLGNTYLLETQVFTLKNTTKFAKYTWNYNLFINVFTLNINFKRRRFFSGVVEKLAPQPKTPFDKVFRQLTYTVVLLMKNSLFLGKRYKRLQFAKKRRSYLNVLIRRKRYKELLFFKKRKNYFWRRKRMFFWRKSKRKFFFWKRLLFLRQKKKIIFNRKKKVINEKFNNTLNPISIQSIKRQFSWNTYFKTNMFKPLISYNILYLYLLNPWFFQIFFPLNKQLNIFFLNKTYKFFSTSEVINLNFFNSNIIPYKSFNYFLVKKLNSLFTTDRIREDFIPYYYHTLIRFLEHCSGKKFLLQIYPFINQNIEMSFVIRYKMWLDRMKFYERRLGHKFFFEEALHIMHISFILRDSLLFSSWLKAIILRINFWKTRLIFRFLRYLFLVYFRHVFKELKVKGLKIKLKGKISVAGNSRKRTILYRTGQTSHSILNLRISHTKRTINTFTGVMGFQIWLFY